ncbi:anthranilate synthase component 1 [Paraglaciecola chathamensis]|uniref:anthranilate synthase component 1 n=1 Tax=Paraglaciecola chathamensis TaxID=368405 RepID=UPI00270F85E6|nr:anthranilate synthase component 1 [Paraglaciecola chathamensis]MDO6839726.1 anthranilate synthase component 1 [Paraglaciecola chathamensis]
MSLAQLTEQAGKVETLLLSADYVADPLQAYQYLCQGKPHNLLLESAEIDSKDDLKSLILVDAAIKLQCDGPVVTCQALTDNGAAALPLFIEYCPQGVEHAFDEGARTVTLTFTFSDSELDEDSRLKAPAVFDALRLLINQVVAIRPHPEALFLGGAFAYDLLATFEQLPQVGDSENTCPDFVFYLAETLLLIDHQAKKTELIGSVFSGKNVGNNYFAISQRLEQIKHKLGKDMPVPELDSPSVAPDELKISKSDQEFIQDVENLKQHILAGDIFQVVPSRTFSLPCPDPHKAYKALKVQNPSPYMFFMQDIDFCMFGASPESALKYLKDTNQVEIYPIAGTRPRGKHADGSINLDLDSRIELNLREDEKEKSEHLMLVDLARNDVAKVSKPGTRHLKDLLKVDRYSHVMHLVSKVVGQLRDDLDALHAYQACMNMGTLVGAPKVSAASLIREVEKQRRGSYGGAVGYVNGHGDMDTCIVIRSAFIKNNTAHIQAGAGVVFDSDPQSEADETRGKAQAVIRAILTSHEGPSAVSPNPTQTAKEAK